jgi:DNA mismatch endonuclease (patch repair protein)
MADVHDKATRSYNMSRIRGKDTKPELIVRKFLSSQGYRYRLNDKNLPGKPDIVLHKYKTVIFVHGCFWHGHRNCKYFILPKTRTKWWQEKIEATQKRDKRIAWLLKKLGWKVSTIYECKLKPGKKDLTLKKLQKDVSISGFL